MSKKKSNLEIARSILTGKVDAPRRERDWAIAQVAEYVVFAVCEERETYKFHGKHGGGYSVEWYREPMQWEILTASEENLIDTFGWTIADRIREAAGLQWEYITEDHHLWSPEDKARIEAQAAADTARAESECSAREAQIWA